MIFGNRPLREVTESDIRALVKSEMAEHLQLEYKSAGYERTEAGNREFLQDICQFANAAGGVLLIGVSELSGKDGFPDPAADLGVVSANPDAELRTYDARIVSGIQERLAVESYAVPVQDGRFVMIFRVPSSLRKPHCVRMPGETRSYFTSRRERNKYEMDVREIKEQTMRAASQLDRAKEILDRELRSQVVAGWPALFVAQLPVFHRDYLVEITSEIISHAIKMFDIVRLDSPLERIPVYTFSGLQRSDPTTSTIVALHRNGMLTLRAEIPGRQVPDDPNSWLVDIAAIDLTFRGFLTKAKQFYATAELDTPSILGVEILSSTRLQALWRRERVGQRVLDNEERRFVFPPMEIGGPGDDVDRVIRPICDHIYQMFGLERSFCFDEDGDWIPVSDRT